IFHSLLCFFLRQVPAAVIGGHGLEIIRTQTVPHRLHLRSLSEWRPADVALAVWLLETLTRKVEINGPGLAVNDLPSCSGFANRRQGFFAGEMDKVDRGVGVASHGESALHGQSLGQPWSRVSKITHT